MRWFVSLVLALALGVMGCSETAGTGGSAGDGGSAGVGGEGGDGGTNGEPLSVRLFISSFEPPLPWAPAEGVRICELETDNCAVTDAGGLAMLELSVGEVALSMEGEETGPMLYTYILRASPQTIGQGNFTETRFEEMFELVDSPYPMQGTGALYVTGCPEGAMLRLLNGTGKPYYNEDDEKQSWNPDLTTVTPHGAGGFVELAPGEYQVEVTGTSESCVPARGWPGDSDNTVRIPVREGYLSNARVECD